MSAVEDPVPLPTGVRVPVLLGYLESLSTMWVSVKDYPGYQDEEELVGRVQQLLENQQGLLPLQAPAVNTLCIARYRVISVGPIFYFNIVLK